MACCSSHILFIITNLLLCAYSTRGGSILTDTNNGYKPQKQIDCDQHQNGFMCPFNKPCTLQCDASNPCHHLHLCAESASSLILTMDPRFVSDLTLYAPFNDNVQIYKLITDTNNHQRALYLDDIHYAKDVMDIRIVSYSTTQQRQLLGVSTTTLSPAQSSSSTTSQDAQSGLSQLIQQVDKQYILWLIIGALVVSICCVTCCCLYFFHRTQATTKKMKKLSIAKPSKINIIKPPNHGLRSPTANTVATYSSYGTNPTASPAGFSVQSDVSPYHIQPPNHRNKSYHSARSQSPQSPYNIPPNYKIDPDCDHSLSADETLEPVLLTANSSRPQEQSTIRSMDVDDIQLTPHVSAQESYKAHSAQTSNSTQSNATGASNEYVGFVMNYNNTPTAQTWHQLQPNDARNMCPIRSHSSSVPFQNNMNHNATWNAPSYPHRNTVAVMHPPAAYPQHPMSRPRPPNGSVTGNQSAYVRHNNHNMQNTIQNNANDARFRFQPQYQYPPPPPKPQYNIKVMRPQMNTIDIPPPPLPKEDENKFESLQIVQDEQSEMEMTHITSSTLASLNTADFEDSNSDSVSGSASQSDKPGMERQETDATDATAATAANTCIKHISQETYATHTMCRSDVLFDIHSKDVDSVIFSVPVSTEPDPDPEAAGEVEDETYMKLQRHLQLLDTKSVWALDNEPEHSPNNSMVTLDNINVNEDVSCSVDGDADVSHTL